MDTKRGFSLIEILVATTILAVLLTVGVVSFSSVSKRSRDSRRKSDVEQLRSALELYRADTGYYPNSGGGSFTNVSNLQNALVTGGYMPLLPADPKSTGLYIYRYRATNASGGQYYGYCLSSLLESETSPTSSCTPDTGQNYGMKSP